MDIVIPKNNEEEFISMAEKLGYNELYFLYGFNDYLDKGKIEIKNRKIKINIGVLIDNKNINKVRKLKNENVFVVAKSSGNDKEVIEKLKPNIIFSFEGSLRKDFIHQRASGLNHILCRSAKENNVTIGFSSSSILNKENKGVILGRIKQNIKLCKKFKVKTIIASFAEKPFDMRSVHDVASLFTILNG